MMRLGVWFGAIGLVACATGTPEGGPRDNGAFPTSSGVSVRGGAGAYQGMLRGNSVGRTDFTTSSDLGMATVVSAPLDTALVALQKAYLSMGLEITKRDEAAHEVGNPHVVVLHKMLGHNLSAFFDCGPDAVMGWPRADHYQVIFSVVSTLSPADAGRTRVVTLVTATASDVATSASAIYCSSTGALEKALLQAAGYPQATGYPAS